MQRDGETKGQMTHCSPRKAYLPGEYGLYPAKLVYPRKLETNTTRPLICCATMDLTAAWDSARGDNAPPPSLCGIWG